MVVRQAMLATALGVVLLAGSAVFAAATADAAVPDDVVGCDPGWACIFNPNPRPIGTVERRYFHYDVYNLSGELGTKTVCDEQTGGAIVRLYTGYNGTGKVAYTLKPDGDYGMYPGCKSLNITPINSIRLSAH